MNDPPQSEPESDRGEGADLAQALRRDATVDLEAGRVRAAAKAAIFGIEPANTVFGRYFLLGMLGQGGMGVVYEAYDPKLDRKVALKVLHERSDGEVLAREARALAKVRHPNVVHVYDVDTVGGKVYLTMELVEGEDLRGWLARDASRPWPEVLRVLVQAGRGLAAVHEAGLVHRDFKPTNVLVDGDGVARVADFGLARADGAVSARGATDSDGGRSSRTSTAGTPAYMAPERSSGAPAQPVTDVYSYSVTLFEALTGRRAFSDVARRRRRIDKLEAELGELPGWLRAVVLRGLEDDPSRRPATMQRLLGELESGLRARDRARVWARAGFVGVPVVAALIFGVVMYNDNRPSLCSGAEDAIAQSWNDARRDQVRTAMLQTSTVFAQEAWQHSERELDAWAAGWSQMHTDTCEVTRLRGEQSEAVMDLRMGCLGRARLGFDAVTNVLAEADAGLVRRAHEVVAELPELSRCADVEALQADVPPPLPAQRPAVDAIAADLAEARARAGAGQYDAALLAVRRAEAGLEEVDHAPTGAEVALELAHVLDRLGRYAEAEEVLRGVLHDASRRRQWEAVGRAAAQLLFVLGVRQDRHAEALALRELSIGSARSPKAIAIARNHTGLVLEAQTEYKEAEKELRAALAIDLDAPAKAMILGNLALVLNRQGKLTEAEAELRSVLALLREKLGPRHPDVAASHNAIGMTLQNQGRYEEAEDEYRAALAVWKAAVGDDHPEVAMVRANLGNTLRIRGQYEAAETELRAALAVLRASGVDGRLQRYTRVNLINVLQARGRLTEAEAEARAALADTVVLLGDDHFEVGALHHNLANVLVDLEEYAEAESGYRAAISIFTRVLGPEHARVAGARVKLGRALTLLGRHDEAEAELEAGLRLKREALGPKHADVGAAHVCLGALAQARGDHDRAVTELETAVAILEPALGAEHPKVTSTREQLAAARADSVVK